MDPIDKIICKLQNKRIIAYGACMCGLQLFGELTKKGLELQYYIDGDNSKQGTTFLGKNVKSPYDLLYETDRDYIVILCGGEINNASMKRTLISMGVSSESIIDDYDGAIFDASYCDALTGLSRGKASVVNISEKEDEKDITILILGGSAADPTYNHIHSWSYYLNDYLKADGIKARVLNAANVAFGTGQELMVMMREGLYLDPDIVISYSGYNDCNPGLDIDDQGRYAIAGKNLLDLFGYVMDGNKIDKESIYYGPKSKDLFLMFSNNVRTMHAICNEFGIDYSFIFQPMIHKQIIPKESFEFRAIKEEIVSSCIERYNSFYGSFKLWKEKYEWVYDFSDIFIKSTNCFFDTCHTNERANMTIAKEIEKVIISKIYEQSLG